MKNSANEKKSEGVMNQVVREVAMGRYNAQGVSDDVVREKMQEVFSQLSDNERSRLFKVSGRYVEAMKFVAEKYFTLWIKGAEKKAAVGEIHYLSGFNEKEKWIFWDIFNELTGFVWQITEDGLKNLALPHIHKYNDVVAFLKEGSKTYLPKKAKAVTVVTKIGKLPSNIFTRLCCAIEAIMNEQLVEFEEKKRLATEKAAKEKAEAQKRAIVAKKAAAEKATETLKKILGAEKVQMNPSGFAFKLDGIITSKDEAKVLNQRSRFLFDGTVYVVDIKDNKKIIRQFFGGTIRKETVQAQIATEVEVIENLDILWLTSLQGKKTVRARIVPAGLSKASFVATCQAIPVGEMVAVQVGKEYKVASINHRGTTDVGIFRQATYAEKKAEKRRLEELSAIKKAVKVPAECCGRMAEAFQSAAMA